MIFCVTDMYRVHGQNIVLNTCNSIVGRNNLVFSKGAKIIIRKNVFICILYQYVFREYKIGCAHRQRPITCIGPMLK